MPEIADNQTPILLILASSLLWGVAGALLFYLIAKLAFEFRPEKRDYKVQVPIFFKLLLPVARRFQSFFRRPEFAVACSKADVKLIQAGLDQTFTPEEFVGLRFCYAVVFVPVAFVLLAIGGKMLSVLGLLFLAMGVGYPLLWLNGQIKLRHRHNQRALPNVLDLLTLSVEAGRDFLSALRDILQNRDRDALSEELERVFREVQLGKQRRQALRAMAERVRQADLNSVVETLVQADELGVSIGHILRILGDQMRQKRFSHAEKLANESPVKLLFPLFIFIFPAVIIVMLGPILLRSLGQFGP